MYVGQKVEVRLNNNSETIDADIIGLHENGILLAFPRDYLLEINFDDSVIVEYVEEKGKDAKRFETNLRKKISKTNLALFTYPKKVDHVERRKFFRFTPWEEMNAHYSLTDLEVDPKWLKYFKRSVNDLALPLGYKKARVIDISGGGIAIATGNPLKKDKKIGIVLSIKDQILKFNGQVVGCGGKNAPYKAAIQFLDVKPSERDKIVRFVFQQASGLMRRTKMDNSQELNSTAKLVNIQKPSDKRGAMRLCDIAIPIEYKIVRNYVDAVESISKSGLLRNISVTGASFLTKENVPLKNDIWLRLPISENFVSVLGETLRSRRFEDIGESEVGVKFKGIDLQNQKKLSAFIYSELVKKRLQESKITDGGE